MFQNDDMSVFDWWLYWILMAIPIINVIVWLIILFSSSTNRSLKHMLWANVLIVIIVIALFATILAPYWQLILPQIQEYINMIRNSLPY